MTYAQFLLVFLAPPILVLAALRPWRQIEVGARRAYWALPLVMGIAFVYTTPWDNYLVYREVWGYGPERVLAVIGYVPLEEYLFFLLQPLMTGLFLYRLLRGVRVTERADGRRRGGYLGGMFFYIAITVLGVACLLGPERSLYMGLILAWAGPVLLGLWLYGGHLFLQLGRPFWTAIAIPTVYLWVADKLAIGLGIWDISNRYSFDIDPFGLPIEEAAFFLVTNILVVQGTALFLFGDRMPLPAFARRLRIEQRSEEPV